MPAEPAAEPTADAPRRKPRTLALELVASLGDRIRDGRISPGDKLPTEAAVMAEFGVSRTVVREALSKLQASGLVETRHGIGTFVVGLGDTAPFRIAHDQIGTLRDVIAVLELRIGIETRGGRTRRAAPHRPQPGRHARGARRLQRRTRGGSRRSGR